MHSHQHKWNSWFRKHPRLRIIKRVVVIVIGGTVTLLGFALIVLPGPAIIVIPIGLAILATEFLWANRCLKKARKMADQLTAKVPNE
jgi:tellurite resistance protein TerC